MRRVICLRCLHICFLTVALLSVLGQPEPKNVKLGGKLNLIPDASMSSENITSLSWKHRENLVVEWNDVLGEMSYGRFKGRTRINQRTGELVIADLTKDDGGEYSVEVNGVLLEKKYEAILIKAVPKPSVVVQPLVCTSTSSSCTLSCNGVITGAGSVTYSWKENGGQWEVSEQQKNISNTDETRTIESFSCQLRNGVSVEESEPCRNPFFVSGTAATTAVIVLVVLAVLTVVVVVAAVVLRKHQPTRDRIWSSIEQIDCLKGLVTSPTQAPEQPLPGEPASSEPFLSTGNGATALPLEPRRSTNAKPPDSEPPGREDGS
ncbi:CD48 antigen-like isoform X1 [Lampris incognitus]|uniref:CD48 antigen-like isoform X1 n=1 Tax=Lampris incognitus TaxID=2546036 RepID=UPI0024B508CD|nr:CD48 antigen-like isoform X1 [Lampris incognitus]